MTQFYLIKIYKMMTSDEVDIVPCWSACLSEDVMSSPMLQTVTEMLSLVLTDAPVTGLRPMTEAEIETYRNEQED